ncbi:uncharacterized protein LOC142143610 isoform X2 [Mixophyes fleayi]|uniref:uncharacterized protein LOC142143610 isoform X2 n=1 Tax=Mixophyes fleayi TaxID=3061075 RepID=UPI003F4D97CA
MTPTFQVTLCFCILALCYTAPKTRNVRWCVTSDSENQKCNDLVKSCSIHEILLFCVKRASTEDCMRAISDGDADAISMDSGNLYKASLNPYKLKPIMEESRSFHRDITPCLRKRLLARKRPLLGAYVPQCDEKGDYRSLQCHGSTGYCWCINSNGEEIAGTKTPPGQTRPTCGVPAHTPCLKERQKHGEGQPLKGAYVPQCDEKGDYSPQQCHGSTGYCWCVNTNGEEIAGTKTPPGNTRVTCEVPAHTPCLKERQKHGGGKPLRGAYVPQCDEKGDYSPQQCHGSTGYCWCVNRNGTEIAGTKTPPGNTRVTCEVPAHTPCLKERQKHGEGQPLKGAYVPQCDEKGDYSPQQCHGSTGYCWCVNTNGEEIAGTKTPPGNTRVTCEVPAHTPCLKERQKHGGGKPLRGAYVPQCDEKGDYSPQQCHGSTGYCWCVNRNGTEIAGTKTPPGNTRVTCEVPAHTPCLKERQKHGGGQPLRGAYVPQCDEKGDYSLQQCHGSTGYCWCVNTNGEEIAGTKTPPGNTRVTCEVPAHTPCLKERQKLGGGQPLLGAYVPQCDEKGDYSPQQCHGSTGYCWCVNANGEEIAGTKTPPGQTRPTCKVPAHTPCLKERQKHGGGKPLLGAYVPQCDEKGDYSPQQCHGSTGYCWCVNANGEEIAGTKTPPGQTPTTCGAPVVDTPCLKERKKLIGDKTPQVGAHVPQCDEKGDYHPLQCHGSSGYCWCVDTNGKEIAGTKTPPGHTRPTCGVPAVDTPCLKERKKLIGDKTPQVGAYVPQCDEKGDYHPLQCHGSSGYCWCVDSIGKEIAGTKYPPGQTRPTCGVPAVDTPCLKERKKLIGDKTPQVGAYVPQCDEKGDYHPLQCHGSSGYCWCVDSIGKEIAGTKSPPGQTRPTCGVPAVDTPCLKARKKLIGDKTPLVGAHVPQCDEKGNFNPLQCHGSSGYCWCVDSNGEEIAGTKTPPGQTRPTCGVPDSDTCPYAVAVVKKSRRFNFNELKGKTSCHSKVGNTASWNAPIKVLLKKNLLQWEGPEKKSIEKAVSEFFSASCIPGAKEANLCKQCAGEGDKKCQHSPVEPYYGDDGAFRCLRDDKGDVAFVKSTGLPGEYSKDYELLCPDNTRKPLNEAKDCNLGKVPSNAVVTRSSCDKSVDIIEFLLEAQKKQCNLFGSIYGKDLLFEGSTNSLIPLPSEMDTFLFLGAEWFNDMKALTVVDPPSKNKVHWCTQNRLEKLKCDDWSSVSGGAILCTEASSPDKCIEQIVKGEADAATLDVNHMYTALKCGLVPALEEYYNKDDLSLCKIHGSGDRDFGTQYAVALAKKSNKGISWNNLEGKKSCHTGVGHAIGWNIPVTLITKQTNNCDIGSYFNQSCAPGSTLNSNLCKLCIGDPENPKANTKCSLSDKEAYYGNEGAFRCLVEKGDVAFVSHTVVFENTDGKNSAGWAKNLNSNDFDLLCRDGSRASVSEYKNCNLARMPPRAIVTREESVTDVVRIVNNQQSLYGRKGFEKDIFQMFTSQQGQNLLFRDDTQCLIEFDRLLEDIVLDYFGPNYPRPNQCTSKSGLLSACTFHHC